MASMLHMKEGTWLDSGAAVVVVVVVVQGGTLPQGGTSQHAIVSLVPELVDPQLNVHIPRVCLFSLRFQRAGRFLQITAPRQFLRRRIFVTGGTLEENTVIQFVSNNIIKITVRWTMVRSKVCNSWCFSWGS